MAYLLDFEKPLVDLEAKLRELRDFEADDGPIVWCNSSIAGGFFGYLRKTLQCT